MVAALHRAGPLALFIVIGDVGAGLTVTAAEAKPAQGGRMTVATVDVTDRKAVGAFVEGIGRVDVLVNNAGGVCGQIGQPLEQVTPRQWQEIFDVNVTGAFNFAQAVAPSMKACASVGEESRMSRPTAMRFAFR